MIVNIIIIATIGKMETLRNLVDDLIKNKGMTQTAIAKKANVSQATINKILNTETKQTLEVIEKFSNAFNVPLYDLVSDSQQPSYGISRGQPLAAEEESLLNLFKKLHPAEKAKVMEIAELYAGLNESRRNVGGGSALRVSNSK